MVCSTSHSSRNILSTTAYAMTEMTQRERLDAARQRFQELKKRNEHLFKPQAGMSSRGDGALASTEPGSVELAELRSTIEQQEVTIKKLRDENTSLKLERLDLSDKIAELEQQLTIFQSGQHSPVQLSTPLLSTHSTQHAPAQSPVLHETSEAPVQSLTNSSDIKEHIMSWKHWNVDMRGWNGSKYTQIVL